MTREEVVEIMNYCKEHEVTYKSRLEELNIPVWRFYDSKSCLPPRSHLVKRLKVSLSNFRTADLLFRFLHLSVQPVGNRKVTDHANRIERDRNTYTYRLCHTHLW